MKKLSSLSLILPTLNDEHSLPLLLKKTIKILPKICYQYEIIIVNDGSKDRTKPIIKKLQKQSSFLKLINHQKTQGYGASLVEGFRQAKFDFIFYTDSDGQYDIGELYNLVDEMDNSIDMVSGYKIKRSDSFPRKIVGNFYNWFVRTIYRVRVKDVDCDFRLFRRSILKKIQFKTKGGAFDAEFMKKIQEKGARIKEVPVNHYPRLYGQSQFFKIENIFKSLIELIKI